MILIFSNSLDTTTDLLIDRLVDIPVFRFNIDLWRQYGWDFNSDGFVVEDPSGRRCDSASTVLVYQRKPIFLEFIDVPAGGCLENWCREEVSELWKNVYQEYCARGCACLIHPGKGRWGKLRQLWMAQRYFRVPAWSAFHGRPCPEGLTPAISKAISQTPIGAGKLFFTKEVTPEKLDPQYPWFVQNKVNAQADVTVAYVKGDLFAFELDRSTIQGVDYRVHLEEHLDWKPCTLKASEETAIRSFMEETGYSFGRLDLLREDGELVFLELNPNGQWAWLDEQGEHGLLLRVAQEIREMYRQCAGGEG